MAKNVTNLRQGAVFQENNEPFQVIKYTHTKMGRGMATIKLKVRSLVSGSITDKTYSSGSKVEEADVVRTRAQFLYSDGRSAVFMEKDTYEQFEIPASTLKDELSFLKPGREVHVVMYESNPIGIELPLNVTMEVTYAEPGVKGNTANAALIKVQVESGLELMTPMFIKVGDLIKIDTRSGEYLERAN
jgi:elongation factor P